MHTKLSQYHKQLLLRRKSRFSARVITRSVVLFSLPQSHFLGIFLQTLLIKGSKRFIVRKARIKCERFLVILEVIKGKIEVMLLSNSSIWIFISFIAFCRRPICCLRAVFSSSSWRCASSDWSISLVGLSTSVFANIAGALVKLFQAKRLGLDRSLSFALDPGKKLPGLKSSGLIHCR